MDERPTSDEVKYVDIFAPDKEFYALKYLSLYNMVFQMQPNILIPWVQHLGLMQPTDIDKQMIRYQFGTNYLRENEISLKTYRKYSGRYDIAFQNPSITEEAVEHTKIYYICELLLICQEIFYELNIEKYDMQINHPSFVPAICKIFGTSCVDIKAKIKNHDLQFLYTNNRPLYKILASKIPINEITSVFLLSFSHTINATQYQQLFNLFNPLHEMASNLRLRSEKILIDFVEEDLTDYYNGYYISCKLKGDNNEFKFIVGGEYTSLIQKFAIDKKNKDIIGMGLAFNISDFSQYYYRSIAPYYFDVLVYDDKFIHGKEEVKLIEKLWGESIKATSYLSDCDYIINEADMEKRCRKMKIRFLVKVTDDSYSVKELVKKKANSICDEANVNYVVEKIKAKINNHIKLEKESNPVDKNQYFNELCSSSIRIKGSIQKCPFHPAIECNLIHVYQCINLRCIINKQFSVEDLHLFDDWVSEKWSPSILFKMGKKKKQILSFSERLFRLLKQEIEEVHTMRKGQQFRKSKDKEK